MCNGLFHFLFIYLFIVTVLEWEFRITAFHMCRFFALFVQISAQYSFRRFFFKSFVVKKKKANSYLLFYYKNKYTCKFHAFIVKHQKRVRLENWSKTPIFYLFISENRRKTIFNFLPKNRDTNKFHAFMIKKDSKMCQKVGNIYFKAAYSLFRIL